MSEESLGGGAKAETRRIRRCETRFEFPPISPTANVVPHCSKINSEASSSVACHVLIGSRSIVFDSTAVAAARRDDQYRQYELASDADTDSDEPARQQST